MNTRARSSATSAALTVVVVVLLGLVVVGDVVARQWAQGRVATQVQTRLGCESPPDVRIGGISFLWQAITKQVSETEITARGVTSTAIPLKELRVQLRDVHLGDNYDTALASEASGTAVASWSSVSGQSGLRTSHVAPDRVRARKTMDILGQHLEVSVEAHVGLSEERQLLMLRDPQLRIQQVELPAGVTEMLINEFLRPVPLPLPGTLHATAVRSTDDGLEADFTAKNLDLYSLG